MVDVIVVRDRGVSPELLREVAAVFNGLPGPIRVQVDAHSCLQLGETDQERVCWASLEDELVRYRRIAACLADALVTGVVSCPNEHSFFAFRFDGPNACFIHADDFSYFTSAPRALVVAALLIRMVLATLVDRAGRDWTECLHDEPRGCVGDLCTNKLQLAVGLRTGDICEDCLLLLQNARVPDALLVQVAQVMDAVRRHSVGVSRYLPATETFATWPFPVAVTKHRAALARDEVRRFFRFLDHFDSLMRYSLIATAARSGRSVELRPTPSLGDLQRLALGSANLRLRRAAKRAAQCDVVRARNEYRGHGYLVDDPLLIAPSESVEAALADIEGELAPDLTNDRLILLQHVELNRSFVVYGELLAGSNSIHPAWQMELSDDPRLRGLDRGRGIYLTDPEHRTFYPLGDDLVYAECSTCRHPRVLIADGEKRIEIQVGHRVPRRPEFRGSR
jgi:hypothetical protein